jgi:hypothetical protein
VSQWASTQPAPASEVRDEIVVGTDTSSARPAASAALEVLDRPPNPLMVSLPNASITPCRMANARGVSPVFPLDSEGATGASKTQVRAPGSVSARTCASAPAVGAAVSSRVNMSRASVTETAVPALAVARSSTRATISSGAFTCQPTAANCVSVRAPASDSG